MFTSFDDIDLKETTVFLRCDLDEDDFRNPRMENTLSAANKLIKKGVRKLIIAGHKGRPVKREEELSLSSLVEKFTERLEREVEFISYDEFSGSSNSFVDSDKKVFLLENLRFWEGEVENSQEFCQKLYDYFQPSVYVNEAFATSHREHASVFGFPKLVLANNGQVVLGERFIKEVEILTKILNEAQKPSIILISGVKEDKLKYVDILKDKFDEVLVAGRLPDLMQDIEKDPITQKVIGKNIIVANLNQDKEDITIRSIEIFEEKVKDAKTIIVSGPIGKFEDEGQRLGTKRVFTAIANSNAYKVAGGGDTEEAIKEFGLENKFDWISVGGGAMLYFLDKKTLPVLSL